MSDATRGSTLDAAAPAPAPNLNAAWGTLFRQKAEERARPVMLMLPSAPATPPIMVMRMPIKALIKHGFVPDPLTPIIEEHIKMLEGIGRGQTEDIAEQFNQNPEATFTQWLDVVRSVWCSCVVEPKFVMDEDDADEENGPYPVAAVDYFDLLYVYQWAQGVDQSVQDFLYEQGKTLGNLAAGEGVPLSAEPTVRIERRDGRLVGVLDRPGDVAVGVEGRGVDEGDGERPRAEEVRPNDGRKTKVRGEVDRTGDLRPAAKRPRKQPSRADA